MGTLIKIMRRKNINITERGYDKPPIIHSKKFKWHIYDIICICTMLGFAIYCGYNLVKLANFIFFIL